MLGVYFLVGLVPAMANQVEDEAAIRKVMEKLFSTWNAKDLDVHFALIDESFVENDNEKGKAAHREYLEKLFSSEDYSQIKLGDEIDCVFVTPDVAIYRSYGLFLKSNQKWTGAWVFSKKTGNWLLSAAFGCNVEE